MATHRHILTLLIVTCLVSTGCGYMLGPPAVEGVRTIHVPVFRTDSARRNLENLLTEAVQREIQTRTRYRLADEHSADTVLQGQIVDIRKDVLSENKYDDARELQLTVGAKVTWLDRRSGRILQQHTFPISQTLAQQSSQVSFAPELGHSLASAQQESAGRLAAQIVDLTEAPW